jgi:methyl-accepting chemotaxis protein
MPASRAFDVKALLPRGTAISDASFDARHRVITTILWLHLPVVFAVSLGAHETFLHTLTELIPVVVLAVVASSARGRSMRAMGAVAGLLTCSMVLIHVTGGLIEMHFHIFAVLPLIALYQDWRPFLVALGIVVVHHTVMPLMNPRDVFNHAAAQHNPILWAAIHAVFVVVEEVFILIFWRAAEQAQIDANEANARAAEESERQLQRELEAAAVQREAADENARQLATLRALEADIRDRTRVLDENTSDVEQRVATVAEAMQQLSSSFQGVATHVSEAAQVADDAVGMAVRANADVTRLGESSAEIGKFVAVIQGIAEQTNLLALNATIESARAGEIGKGFAVVAHEVKDLANQAAAATDDISAQVGAIQRDIDSAVDVIARISEVVKHIAELQDGIASSVEEQVAVAAETFGNAQQAADATQQIAGAVRDVAQLVT